MPNIYCKPNKDMKKLFNILGLFLIVAFTIIPFIPQPVNAGTTWYNASWQYVKKFTMNGTVAGVLINYKIPIKVYYGIGTDGTEVSINTTAGKAYLNGKCKTDFSDIRFLKSDNVTLLDYYKDEYTASSYALFYVELDYLPAAPTQQPFYMYYGNSVATSTSNITNVFTVYDDFERSTNGTAIGGSWTQIVAGATINTDHAYSGTRSAKFSSLADYTFPGFAITSNTTEIHMRLWKEDATGNMNLYRGNGVNLQYTWATNAEDIFNNSADTTKNTVANTWRQWVFTNYDWIAAKSDIYEGGVNAATGGVLPLNNTNNGIFKFLNDDAVADHDFFIDDLFVRSYVLPEPAFSSWGSEEYFNVIDKLVIQSVGIFKSYINTGDWLITILYKNIYPPYYANKDNVKQYFSLQFLDSSYNVKAQVACPEWDYKPGSIYLNASQVTAFTWGGTYYVRLIGNFTGNPYIQYTIKSTDWVDGNLTILDSWVLSSADLLADYYAVTMTTYVADRGKLLNATGGVLFANGITGLLTQRPDIFQISSRTTPHPIKGDTSSGSGETLTTWQVMVGPYVAEQLNNGGILFGVDGKSFGAWILIIIMIALMAFGLPSGHTAPANILALPIFFMGLGLRFFDWATGAVMLSLMILLLWYNIWLKHG